MTTAAVPTPVWTVFPAQALPEVRWENHVSAHRGIMSLFPAQLPGNQQQRRSGSGILYRIDAQPDGSPLVLVQSHIVPVHVPPVGQVKHVPDHAWTIPTGTTVQFRLAICPVLRRKDPDDPRGKRDLSRIVSVDETPDWLRPRLADALANVTVVNDARHDTIARPGSQTLKTAPPRLTIASIDAFATVADAGAFAELRASGVGRYRAYGAGLLTARLTG